MKNYNISRQNPSTFTAWKKEYIKKLDHDVNSLYYYLHYYNPEWKLVNDESYTGLGVINSNRIIDEHLLNDFQNYIHVDAMHWEEDDERPWGFELQSYGDNILWFYIPDGLQEIGIPYQLLTTIYLKAGTYWMGDSNSLYNSWTDVGCDYNQTDRSYPYTTKIYPAVFMIIDKNETEHPLFGQTNKQITIPKDGNYNIYFSFPDMDTSLSDAEQDQIFLYLGEKNSYIDYGEPVAPTERGIYLSAFAYRWGLKNETDDTLYIDSVDELGNYRFLNVAATLFKVDAEDEADFKHFMIFEGALAQYYQQSYSFDVSGTTMTVSVTNTLVNAAEKGTSYPMQVVVVPPRYYRIGESLVSIVYNNNSAISNIIYDNNNRIAAEGSQPAAQKPQLWCQNTDICYDIVIERNGQFEPLLGDFVETESYITAPVFKVYLDKPQSQGKDIEDNFKAIIY